MKRRQKYSLSNEERRIREIADDLEVHLQAACGDIAHDSFGGERSPWMTPAAADWAESAEAAGCADLVGAYADKLYNDAACVEDLIGDRLYDATNGNTALRTAVLDLMATNAHDAMATAISNLRRN